MHRRGTVETAAVTVSGFEPSVVVMLAVVAGVVAAVVVVAEVVLAAVVEVVVISLLAVPGCGSCVELNSKDINESNRNVVTIM